ncbi:MAG: pyridoxamine 5'-phosphate oxidase [Bacteroidales bacterium]|nr:pyridoxamine 5'-phosphate oxidase [Bacteroidales bacterium]
MAKSYYHIRQNYGKSALNELDMPNNPLVLFEVWFDQALKDNLPDANAMVLSTAINDKPSSRIVLLKAVEEGKLIFFTNYRSRKGKEINQNPFVSLLFFWPQHERQVRIEGHSEKLASALSDEYFVSRPRESQAAAIASNQSEAIADKTRLLQTYNQLLKLDDDLKRPGYWGGYQVLPEYFEFWQGGAHRLHDRITYSKTGSGWQIGRLLP